MLKALKNDLKKWNVEAFGNVDCQRRCHFEEMLRLEERAKIGALSEEDLSRKNSVTVEVENMILLEEIFRRQKSWALWPNEGD